VLNLKYATLQCHIILAEIIVISWIDAQETFFTIINVAIFLWLHANTHINFSRRANIFRMLCQGWGMFSQRGTAGTIALYKMKVLSDNPILFYICLKTIGVGSPRLSLIEGFDWHTVNTHKPLKNRLQTHE